MPTVANNFTSGTNVFYRYYGFFESVNAGFSRILYLLCLGVYYVNKIYKVNNYSLTKLTIILEHYSEVQYTLLYTDRCLKLFGIISNK